MSCDEFVEAIVRKQAIADYHFSCLEPLLNDVDGRQPVPISVQAHFEGLLYSVIACADQSAAGLYAVAELGIPRAGLDHVFVNRYAHLVEASEPMRELKQVWNQGEMLDVREIRRRATHLYYDKDGRGEHYYVREYELDPERMSSGGPIVDREISSFALIALELGRRVSRLGAASVRELAGHSRSVRSSA